MSTTTLGLLYAAALHIGGLAAMVVLVALGTVSWSEGGPIIGYLLGFATGVPASVGVASRYAAPAPPA